MTGKNGQVSYPQMPVPDDQLNGRKMPEDDFNKALKVFLDPNAEEKFNRFFDIPDDSSEVCEPKISPELTAHIQNQRFNGWGSRLLIDPTINFYGCKYSPQDFTGGSYKDVLKASIEKCFTDQMIAQDPALANVFNSWEQNMSEEWDNVLDDAGSVLSQNIKIVTDFQGCGSYYWMRSSADGRHIGNGYQEDRSDAARCPLTNNAAGFFIDLKFDRVIGTNAQYDPGFFPDNKGFTFITQSPHFCVMDGLNPGASTANQVPSYFKVEAGRYCGGSDLDVYQHVGASVDPSRPQYTVVRGKYENDDGAHSVVSDPVPRFGSDSYVELVSMCEKNKCGQGANTGIQPLSTTGSDQDAFGVDAVSYTHLTLPTKA